MSSTTAFREALLREALDLVPKGHRSILIWGFTELAIAVLDRFAVLGLMGCVSGVVDVRPELHGMKIGRFCVLSPESACSMRLDAIVLTRDEEKEQDIRCIAALGFHSVRVVIAGVGHLAFRDPLFEDLCKSLLVRSRAAGYADMLVHLYQCLEHVVRSGSVGHIAEFGVFKGGTTVFLARAARRLGLSARVYAFDTFSGFPPRTSPLDLYDSHDDEYASIESVRAYCSTEDIQLIEGNIAETHVSLAGVPLVLSFFDTDNYSGTRAALETVYEQTVPGGFLAFDHYHCDERWVYTIGERLALQEFLPGRSFFHLHGTGIFMKA